MQYQTLLSQPGGGREEGGRRRKGEGEGRGGRKMKPKLIASQRIPYIPSWHTESDYTLSCPGELQDRARDK